MVFKTIVIERDSEIVDSELVACGSIVIKESDNYKTGLISHLIIDPIYKSKTQLIN